MVDWQSCCLMRAFGVRTYVPQFVRACVCACVRACLCALAWMFVYACL